MEINIIEEVKSDDQSDPSSEVSSDTDSSSLQSIGIISEIFLIYLDEELDWGFLKNSDIEFPKTWLQTLEVLETQWGNGFQFLDFISQNLKNFLIIYENFLAPQIHI